MKIEEYIKRYQQWYIKNHGDKVSVSNQLDKTQEELNEVKKAIIDGDHDHIIDEFGDLLNTIFGLMIKTNVFPNECLDSSINKIESRVYHLVDNQLVKEADLCK